MYFDNKPQHRYIQTASLQVYYSVRSVHSTTYCICSVHFGGVIEHGVATRVLPYVH